MLCEYGCGQEAKTKFINGKWCCNDNHKSCPSMKNIGMPNPITNPANQKEPCKFCKKEYSRSNIGKHEKSCMLNPINIKLCSVCKKLVKKGNKFCSSKCSGSYNTKGRKHSIETKRKISKSVGG